MYAVRRWSVRHAGLLEFIYNRLFEPVMIRLHPLWRRIGYARAENPVALLEKVVKGFLFDCRMCGHCVLSATGMSCPMNCPKQLRNGPCDGVRPNGHCEVAPPDSADPEEVHVRARVYDGYVDAMNATDGAGGNYNMSSVGMCALATRLGYGMVLQISCRDRTASPFRVTGWVALPGA